MVPIITDMAQKGASPYEILVASLLSARTLDTVTMKVAPRLFELARTPGQMLALDPSAIARAIYGVAFGDNKAGQIRALSQILIERYDGQVPDEINALDELPGVGRKIANLVVTQAFGKPGICVDTHVHRITNRWGYVQTRTPDATEQELRQKLPRRYWIEINALLVALGQNICRPGVPLCSRCPVYEYCDRVGVVKHH